MYRAERTHRGVLVRADDEHHILPLYHDGTAVFAQGILLRCVAGEGVRLGVQPPLRGGLYRLKLIVRLHAQQKKLRHAHVTRRVIERAPRVFRRVEPVEAADHLAVGRLRLREVDALHHGGGHRVKRDSGGRAVPEQPEQAEADGDGRQPAPGAKKMIDDICFVPEVGKLYYGKVVRILPIGAFVELAPGKDGMIHISKLENRRVEKVEDVLNIGDMTWVKVTEIDEKGRVNLSRKDALKELAAAADKK